MADKCTAYRNDQSVRRQQRNIEEPPTEYIFLFSVNTIMNSWGRDSNPRHRNDWCLKPAP